MTVEECDLLEHIAHFTTAHFQRQETLENMEDSRCRYHALPETLQKQQSKNVETKFTLRVATAEKDQIL